MTQADLPDGCERPGLLSHRVIYAGILNRPRSRRVCRTQTGRRTTRPTRPRGGRMLKQITMAITVAMVLATVSTGAAAADAGSDAGRRAERLHQHQGVGGISAPPPH